MKTVGGMAGNIAIENCFVSLPPPFVAFTVKVAVPTVVAVPIISPFEGSSDKPAGRDPDTMLQMMGASPVASRVRMYPTPTLPSGIDPVMIVGATGVTLIVIESCAVSLPALFVALIVKVAVAAVVGVPVITPELLIDKPAGRLPDSMLHITGAVPEAASVALYVAPVAPSGSDSVVIVGATAVAVIVIESCFVSLPASFVALTVKFAVPVVVGIPEILPVDSSSNKPAGSVPVTMLHSMGASPVATSV